MKARGSSEKSRDEGSIGGGQRGLIEIDEERGQMNLVGLQGDSRSEIH